MIYGYHRTSTKEQHPDRGIAEITQYCEQNNLALKEIFVDQQTGKNFERPQYNFLKKILEKGDTLIITELDRLGRNKKGILKELEELKDNDVMVRILEIPITLIDSQNKYGDEYEDLMSEMIRDVVIQIYASIAQAELHKKEKRQREGIEAMKRRGEWGKYGRPRSMTEEEAMEAIREVVEGKKSRKQIMEEKNISISTFYKYRKKYNEKYRNLRGK